MSSVSTKWILELVDKISRPLKSIDGNIKNITTDTKVMNKSLKDTSAVNISAIAEGFRSLKNRLNEAVAPGIKFQDGLAEVEAITGVTGKALDSLGDKARKSAKKFGGEASDSLNNYKILLSKLGPDIAQSEDALNSMNSNVLTLSKTMKGDANGAVEALTNSMLQFRVDLSDPIKAGEEMTRMMNTMAAGAKFGSAEVPQVSQAIRVSGVAASQAKVSFEEANAAIQELARGGKVGAEGGMALRNVLNKMAGEDVIPKEALAKLKSYGVNMAIVSDTSLPFTERLRELGKAQNDATAFAQVFGTENAAAANILTRSVGAQDILKNKITDTNVATEQADVIMGTYSEKMKRVSAWTKDLGISLFNATSGFLPFINGGFESIDMLADLKRAQEGVALLMDTKLGAGLKAIGRGFKWAGSKALNFSKAVLLTGLSALKSAGRFVITAVTGLGSFVAGLITATAAQFGLNIAMSANPIGLIVIGIAAAIGAIALMIKYWSQIKAAIWSFTKFMWKISPFRFLINIVEKIFPGFKAKVTAVFGYVKDLALKFWNKIKEIFAKIKSFFGFGDDGKAEVEIKATVNKDGTVIPGLDPTGDLLNVNGGGNLDLSGAGGGGATFGGGTKESKSISMTLNITQHFKVAADVKESIENIANEVVAKINDRMRDAVIALD